MPQIFLADYGNSDAKFMLDRFGTERHFAHQVEEMTKSSYELSRNTYSVDMGFAGTAVFEMDGKFYRVGNGADGKRTTGAGKYTRGHIGALAVASLLHLMPSGGSISMIVMHPAKIVENQIQMMIDALKGEYRIKVPANGRKDREILYNIKSVTPMPEIVAGFQTFLLNEEGRFYNQRDLLKPNTRWLVYDGGGRISAFVPVIINEEYRAEMILSRKYRLGFDKGIQDCEHLLQGLLIQHVDCFKRRDTLPISTLHQAISARFVDVGNNEKQDVSVWVQEAMGELVGQIDDEYQNHFSGGVGYNGIIITGGGGGIEAPYLSTSIFADKYVETAEPTLDKMRYSQIRGALKGLLAARRIRDERKRVHAATSRTPAHSNVAE